MSQFKISILNVSIYSSDISHIINDIISIFIKSDKTNKIITATSAHGLVYSKSNPDFKKILDVFYINLPDGMPTVWIGRLKGANDMVRCYGPDFFRETVIATKDMNIKHFICGGKSGVAEELKEVCELRYGNQNVVGFYSPPFREISDDELKDLAKMINDSCVDIVWIGLSTPKQEIFAYRLSKYTKVHFICTVGAAFDFHTGRLKEAPKWIQNIGMEWFFRFLMEPKRLWKRYFEIVPLFILYNIKELFNGKFFIKTIEENNG